MHMGFDKAQYQSEMRAMVDTAIERMKTEHPNYEVFTASIWTDPNAGASSISFDSKAHSEQQMIKANEWNKKHYDQFIAAGDYNRAKLYEPSTDRNENPADFDLVDFEEAQHEHIELNWEYESDGDCWHELEPALKEAGDYAFYKLKALNQHQDFELSVNGQQDWYEFTWPNR